MVKQYAGCIVSCNTDGLPPAVPRRHPSKHDDDGPQMLPPANSYLEARTSIGGDLDGEKKPRNPLSLPRKEELGRAASKCVGGLSNDLCLVIKAAFHQ